MRSVRLLAAVFLLLAAGGCDSVYVFVIRGEVVRADKWPTALENAGHVLKGTDVGQLGAGVPGAVVNVSLMVTPTIRDTTTVRTDASGHFEVLHTTFGGGPKTIEFVATKEGFAPARRELPAGDFCEVGRVPEVAASGRQPYVVILLEGASSPQPSTPPRRP
jgi:hypothetical protein